MTTIAWDGKTLASDSRMSNGWTGEVDPEDVKKIYALKGTYQESELVAAAFSGDPTQIQLFIDWIQSGADKDKGDEACKHLGVILVTKDKVFEFWGCPNPLERAGAIVAGGSGGTYATSAMLMGKNAREAIAHAKLRDAFSGGPIQSIVCREESKSDGVQVEEGVAA